MTAYTFDQLIDFTRTTAGGYYGSDGLFRVTPASKNLLTYTQEFDNAVWTKNNIVVLPFDPATATLGSEVVANGDFSSTASWSVPVAGASITGGALTFDGVTSIASGSITANSMVTPIVAGRWYAVTYTIIGGTTNAISVNVGGSLGTSRSAAGTYTEYLLASGATPVDISARGSAGIRTGSVDNVSVKEVNGGLIAAPDGTMTADNVVQTASTSSQYITQTYNATTGLTYAFSFYAKQGVARYIQVTYSSGAFGVVQYANIDLQDGAVAVSAGGVAVSLVSAGNGWWRISYTATATATGNGSPFVFCINSPSDVRSAVITGSTSNNYYLWGAQLEINSAATSYARNNGGLYPPRFDYDPVTLAPRGLLAEEQRTNLVTYSEQFENAAWTKASATITANALMSPDGTTDADKIIVNNGATNGAAYQILTKAASAITYTWSVYAKAGEWDTAAVYLTAGTFNDRATVVVRLSDGVITTGPAVAGTFSSPSATVQHVGGGWYRIALTATTGTETDLRPSVYPGNGGTFPSGDGTSGIYVWGAQLETGAFPTSYIPTTASQITRTPDITVITGTNFSNWYGQSAGTFVVEYDCSAATAVTATKAVFATSDGSTNNRVYGYVPNNSQPTMLVTSGGAAQAIIPTTNTANNAVVKFAIAYATNDFAATINGITPGTDTSGTVPSTVNRLELGVFSPSAAYLNGHIRSLRYYPTRLSNAQLQSLST